MATGGIVTFLGCGLLGCAELGSLLESYVEQSLNPLLTFNQESKI